MQPTEQPADVHEPEPQASEETSPEETEGEASPSWWTRLTSRVFSREESEPSPEESNQAPAQPEQRTLTQADIDRLIQSEADRREAMRNKAARDAERKRLRQEDPWAYAEQEAAEEEAQVQAQQQDAQLNDLFQAIGKEHDKYTLDPLMQAVHTQDPKEYERLMQLPGAGFGTEGRKLLTSEALKSLEKRWKAEGEKEAEAKLRTNQAFRKQVFSEFSGGFSSPELLPSGTAKRPNGRGTQVVNDMLRQQVNLPTHE